MKKNLTAFVFIVFATFSCSEKSSGLKSVKCIETAYTVSKVRSAKLQNQPIVVASTYEGTLIGVDYSGKTLWENPLSGLMNHDLWCGDITGDGEDEILAANANGSVYCLKNNGKILWTFKKNDAPMYSVCVIHKNDEAYVVCGGYDKSIYYIDKYGKELKEVSSYNYSVENPWQPYPKPIPDSMCHTANFIRPVKLRNGKEVLAVHGVIHTMAVIARGSVYLFKPLEEKPYNTIELEEGRPLGEMRCVDVNGDGNEELLMGTSNLTEWTMFQVDITDGSQKVRSLKPLSDKITGFGYRVLQPEVIEQHGKKQFFILFGSQVITTTNDFEYDSAEVLNSRYSFNDMWKDDKSNIILASAQSGGNCIHIIDMSNDEWKNNYEKLEPRGKIQKMWSGAEQMRLNLKNFTAPEWQRKQLPVYFMTESIPASVEKQVEYLKENYESPVFLNSTGYNKGENTDRSDIKDPRYFERRDPRRTYDATADEIVDHISKVYEGGNGAAFWGGHGNDPYMYRLSTVKRILDNSNGENTVLIYPELEDHSEHFAYVLDDYFYPLAKYCREKNANIYVRTKHSFWFSNIYLPMWSRLTSGEFADVFVPSMEETTDKSMELSIAARLGVWASGATNSWGSRCARDNASFDRLRQHANQELPSHFLRMMVYHIAQGAQYINNFPVDQEYMSLLWELIAKGALYVPKTSEIVSFSPVHLSMLTPDKHFIEESSNTKWTTFYNEEFEKNNPFVFSRLNGTWPGAAVTGWDFSRYAAGVKDRRLNFLPPYQNGMVLITPPQTGMYADKNAPRGALIDHLHPLYKNIMKEYYTDGRHYYSADGKDKYSADNYYKTIEDEINKKSKLIPLTVSGDDVAWVVSQVSPRHLRLTIIDGGYINPNDRKATITFNTVTPMKLTDILGHTEFGISGNTAEIDVPCGLFRFIDIELSDPL